MAVLRAKVQAPQPKPTPKMRMKLRSPNYPVIGLKNALARVRQIYDNDGRGGSPLAIGLRHMGFSKPGGGNMMIVSALKKFGLIENRSDRLIPTSTAVEILNFPDGLARNKAIRSAALKPEIYRTLFDRYRGAGELPSDQTLRAELESDYGFNPKSIGAFINGFRESLIFASLSDGRVLYSDGTAPAPDLDEDEHDEDMDDREEEPTPPTNPAADKHKSHREGREDPPPAQGVRDVPLPLISGGTAVLRLPSATISEADYEWLRRMLETLKPGITGSAENAGGSAT